MTTIDDAVPAGLVKNRAITRMFGALTALSQRRLGGPDNEKKVVVLLRQYFNEPHEIIEERKKLNIRNNPVPPDWEGERLPIAIAEARQGLHEDLLEETQEIGPIPGHLLLHDADMPKPIKGELGDQNQFSVAEIKNMLGFLYVMDEEED